MSDLREALRAQGKYHYEQSQTFGNAQANDDAHSSALLMEAADEIDRRESYDWVTVQIKRVEGYEEVHPELVLEDATKQPQAFQWRLVGPIAPIREPLNADGSPANKEIPAISSERTAEEFRDWLADQIEDMAERDREQGEPESSAALHCVVKFIRACEINKRPAVISSKKDG